MAQNNNPIKTRDEEETWEAVITYVPFPDEVVPEDYFHTQATHVHVIPPDARNDPFAEAENVLLRFNAMRTVVLVPARALDTTGTRHGRGSGWYDRFLRAIPKTWTRIGFCYDDQFSKVPLRRENWDEPVDGMYVVLKK
jgi:hypothetical protein